MGFFLGAGASFLIKGPFGPVLIGGAAFVFACVERRRAVWRFLFDPVGLTLMTICCLVWPILAYRADPTVLTDWRTHNLDRFTGEYDGKKHPLFYWWIIPSILLPWTPAVIGGLIAGFRDEGRPRSLWRLMACWFGVGLAIISMSAWKHKHYPIPMLPPASIVAAYGLCRYVVEARKTGRSPAFVTAVLLAMAGAAGMAIGATKGQSVTMAVGGFGVVSGVGLALAFRLRRSGRLDAALAALFAATWLVMVLNQSIVMPRFDRYREQAELAGRTNARLAPGEPIYLVEVPQPQVLFYLRHPLKRFDSQPEFALDCLMTRQESPVLVIGPKAAIDDLEAIGTVDRLDRSPTLHQLTTARFTPEPARIAMLLLEGDSLVR